MSTRIQKRRGTAAAWTSANPVLAAGEEGWETDTHKGKTGDGSTAWTSLLYDVVPNPMGTFASKHEVDLTDYANSAAGLAAAFTAAGTNGTVLLPPGATLNLATQVVTSLDGLTFKARGATINCSGAGGIRFAGDDVLVDGGLFTSTDAAKTNPLLYVSDGARPRLRGQRYSGGLQQLWMENCTEINVTDQQSLAPPTTVGTDGILFTDCARGSVSDIIIGPWSTALMTEASQRHGILFSGCSHLDVQGVVSNGNDYSRAVSCSGIGISNCSTCTFTACDGSSNKGADGILVQASSFDITLLGCIGCDNDASAGAGAGVATGDGLDIYLSSKVYVVGGIFKRNGAYSDHPNIEIYDADDVRLCAVNASDCAGTLNANIAVRGAKRPQFIGVTANGAKGPGLELASSPQTAAETTKARVIGGSYSDNNKGTQATRNAGIYAAQASTFSIIGADASDYQGGSATQRYGVRMENTASGVVVACSLDNNVTNKYLDSVGTSAITLTNTWYLSSGAVKTDGVTVSADEIHGLNDVHARYGGGARVGMGALGPAAQAGLLFVGDTNFYRYASLVMRSNGKVTADAGIGVGNSAAATTPGAVVKKMEVFDAAGASLGFVPIYSTIT